MARGLMALEVADLAGWLRPPLAVLSQLVRTAADPDACPLTGNQ
jgi:hypothetical protein